MSALPVHRAYAQTKQAAGSDVKGASEKSSQQLAEPGGQEPNARESPRSTATTPWGIVLAHPWWSALLAFMAVALAVGMGFLLWSASRSPTDPFIMRLGPSFFFWLGMAYTGLLLLMAAAYDIWCASLKGNTPVLLGGLLPIAVPWFGALGAVTISLEGVFMRNSEWDKKYNYWHIARPVFGAVLGIVAFFLFVLIITASGTPPKFLNPDEATGAKDFIVYYVVAFLVGYREETFRDLIKRATDLILRPGAQPPLGPAVTLKGAGVTSLQIGFLATAVGAPPPHVTVQVQNTGNAPLIAPAVVVTATAPAAAATFATANDHVTGGGDLAPGQVKTVDVTFTPQAAGDFVGTLTVTGTNLAAPKTLAITGMGH